MGNYLKCDIHNIYYQDCYECPVCKQEKRIDNLDKKLSKTLEKIDRVGKLFTESSNLFKKILMEVKKSGY